MAWRPARTRPTLRQCRHRRCMAAPGLAPRRCRQPIPRPPPSRSRRASPGVRLFRRNSGHPLRRRYKHRYPLRRTILRAPRAGQAPRVGVLLSRRRRGTGLTVLPPGGGGEPVTGGVPQASAQPSIGGKLASMFSAFNPIGTAEAATRPTAGESAAANAAAPPAPRCTRCSTAACQNRNAANHPGDCYSADHACAGTGCRHRQRWSGGARSEGSV